MSQLGGLTSVLLNQKWQAIAAYYYDLKQHRNIDRLVGLRYDSCCWSVDLVLEQENKTRQRHPDLQHRNQHWLAVPDERFKIVVGSGTDYSLNTQLLPYSRPFNLND